MVRNGSNEIRFNKSTQNKGGDEVSRNAKQRGGG